MHFISFTLIYSLWWLRLKQRAYNFFREGHPRRSTVTLKLDNNFNKWGQIKYPTIHHFQLYYQRADAKITSFLYGCARVASSASAGVSKIKIVLAISSIRSMFQSLLVLVYLSWRRNVIHVIVSTFSFEAAIVIEWLFIFSANDSRVK